MTTTTLKLQYVYIMNIFKYKTSNKTKISWYQEQGDGWQILQILKMLKNVYLEVV